MPASLLEETKVQKKSRGKDHTFSLSLESILAGYFHPEHLVDCNFNLSIHCIARFLRLLVSIVNAALEKVLLKVLKRPFIEILSYTFAFVET